MTDKPMEIFVIGQMELGQAELAGAGAADGQVICCLRFENAFDKGKWGPWLGLPIHDARSLLGMLEAYVAKLERQRDALLRATEEGG